MDVRRRRTTTDGGGRDVLAIGVATHKASLAACAIDGLGRAVSERTFENSPRGHKHFLRWAQILAERRRW
jgi:hypothetical protein